MAYKITKATMVPSRSSLDRLWPYEYADKTTWPYLTCIVGEKRNNGSFVKWIENPNFKFKHLLRKTSAGSQIINR